MLHNTELDIAYNDGVVQGVEQKEIEVIKNMLELKLPISTIAKTLNISEDEIEKMIKEDNLDK